MRANERYPAKRTIIIPSKGRAKAVKARNRREISGSADNYYPVLRSNDDEPGTRTGPPARRATTTQYEYEAVERRPMHKPTHVLNTRPDTLTQKPNRVRGFLQFIYMTSDLRPSSLVSYRGPLNHQDK
jgi:hypothetical protein